MLIEILCKLVRLISRNPIGVNVKLYYGIIGEENLRKEGLNWINWKVLDLIGWLWKVGGLMCNYPQSYKIALTLLILYYTSHLEGKVEIKFCNFIFSFPILLTSFTLIFSKFSVCWKFCITSFLLAIKVFFLNF